MRFSLKIKKNFLSRGVREICFLNVSIVRRRDDLSASCDIPGRSAIRQHPLSRTRYYSFLPKWLSHYDSVVFSVPSLKKILYFNSTSMRRWKDGIWVGNSDPCNEICEFNRKSKILGSMLEKILDFRSIVHWCFY